MRIADRLVAAIRDAARFNKDNQVRPACILWPDEYRQWEKAVPRLQSEMPELFVLGEYQPETRTGPAIWLRCILAGLIPEVPLEADKVPILYLPGVGRQQLRAVDSCPSHLQPLAELQYRGVIWAQGNAKDWTILAFLSSDQGGLSLDVAQDNDSKSAMQIALGRLLDEDLELYRGKRLDKDTFNGLLTGNDPVRDLLQWISEGDTFKHSRSAEEWQAFVQLCKSKLNFHPDNEGVLAAATRLAQHQGPWLPVWQRFREAPKRFGGIPERIRQCQPPGKTLFWVSDAASNSGWPQWNEENEAELQKALLDLAHQPPHEARNRIKEFETQHGHRRTLVWAELGEAPLAQALEPLARLAHTTSTPLAGTLADVQSGYQAKGWQADAAVLDALALVSSEVERTVVHTAIRAIYLPWAEESARHLQKLVSQNGYPGGNHTTNNQPPYQDGECVLFVDGLRFDVAKRLANLLVGAKVDVSEMPVWCALPSVTATGKNAVSPVASKLQGALNNSDFEPSLAETGKPLYLKKLLADNGWQILSGSDYGDADGRAWCEFGDIDQEGHNRGVTLARHLDEHLEAIQERVEALLLSGWRQVRIVTDHGWLLMPGGLPKIDLPGVLADSKWGRCAALKAGAITNERTFPWFWNEHQEFALADGISCYKKGEEYAHGGLSLQECLTLQLVATRTGASPGTTGASITEVAWKGLRCNVAVSGALPGLQLDIRKQAGNAASSVSTSPKAVAETGRAWVMVEDDSLEGKEASLVLLDAEGGLVAQVPTVIGGA